MAGYYVQPIDEGNKIWERLKVSIKKSFVLDCQISLKVLMKIVIKLIHFAWMKLNEVKQRVNNMFKRTFILPTIQTEDIFNEILLTVWQNRTIKDS